MRIRNQGLLVGCLILLALSTACAPVKGYPGPERPDSEISLIQIENDTSSVDVSEAIINGVEFGASGIKVLPGKHSFSFRVLVKGPRENCYSFPEMNRYGYDDCLRDRDKGKRKSCNCYDYLTIKRKCYRPGFDGNCTGDISTRPGIGYAIGVRGYGERADLNVVEKPTMAQVGFGSCQMYGRRTVEEEDNLGTGRYTANQNGVYSCY